MSENRELSYHGHDENDEESDIIYTPGLHEEDNKSTDDSSDIKKALHKPRKIKRSTTEIGSVSLYYDPLHVIDTYDRECKTTGINTYAGTDSYARGFVDEPGKRIPKALALAEAGVGRARAECGIFEAEVKGPNISAGAEARVTAVGPAAGAIVRAELASASAQAGPIGLKLGLGVDTGVSAGPGGIEVKILGTGVSFGSKTSVSVLGSEVSCSVM